MIILITAIAVLLAALLSVLFVLIKRRNKGDENTESAKFWDEQNIRLTA